MKITFGRPQLTLWVLSLLLVAALFEALRTLGHREERRGHEAETERIRKRMQQYREEWERRRK